jgi:hypothetical protein
MGLYEEPSEIPFMSSVIHLIAAMGVCAGAAVLFVRNKESADAHSDALWQQAPLESRVTAIWWFGAALLVLLVSGVWLRFKLYIAPHVWYRYNEVLVFKCFLTVLALAVALCRFTNVKALKRFRATQFNRPSVAIGAMAGVVLLSVLLESVRVAIPIARGSRGALDSGLRGTLASLRNAIDMYAAEHGGIFPDGTQAEILEKLTMKTDQKGIRGNAAGVHIYGPYLRGGMPPLPVCANKGSANLRIVTGVPGGGTGREGWVYSTDTGQIIANCTDAERDDDNMPYNEY